MKNQKVTIKLEKSSKQKKRKAMLSAKVLGAALGLALLLAGCGSEGQGQSGSKTESVGKTGSTGKLENNTGVTEKTKETVDQKKSGKSQELENSGEPKGIAGNEQNTGDTAGDVSAVISNRTELTWYVADDCVAFCYSGEGAEVLAKAVEKGRYPEVTIEVQGYSFQMIKCPYCGENYQFSYESGAQYNGVAPEMYHSGSSCSNALKEGNYCNRAPEIEGELRNGELWIAVRHFTPGIDPTALPYVEISVNSSYDDGYSEEEEFYDTVAEDREGYYSGMPERFQTSQDAGNTAGLSTFSNYNYQEGYAQTDDYMLSGNEYSNNYRTTMLRSFDEDGRLVQVVEFRIDRVTGELVVDDTFVNHYGTKYSFFSNFLSNRSVNQNPTYFSKPYLTNRQFRSMEETGTP